MEIAELKNGQSEVNVEGNITEVGEVRNFNKFGKNLSVATATLEDSSGSIKLSLWNQDIEKVKQGDKVKIENGFVKEFQGELQLTSGKFGKIEVIGKSEKTELSKPKKEETKKMDGEFEEDADLEGGQEDESGDENEDF